MIFSASFSQETENLALVGEVEVLLESICLRTWFT